MSEERERIEVLKQEIRMLKMKLKNKKIQKTRAYKSEGRSDNYFKEQEKELEATQYSEERKELLEETRLANEKYLAGEDEE